MRFWLKFSDPILLKPHAGFLDTIDCRVPLLSRCRLVYTVLGRRGALRTRHSYFSSEMSIAHVPLCGAWRSCRQPRLWRSRHPHGWVRSFPDHFPWLSMAAFGSIPLPVVGSASHFAVRDVADLPSRIFCSRLRVVGCDRIFVTGRSHADSVRMGSFAQSPLLGYVTTVSFVTGDLIEGSPVKYKTDERLQTTTLASLLGWCTDECSQTIPGRTASMLRTVEREHKQSWSPALETGCLKHLTRRRSADWLDGTLSVIRQPTAERVEKPRLPKLVAWSRSCGATVVAAIPSIPRPKIIRVAVDPSRESISLSEEKTIETSIRQNVREGSKSAACLRRPNLRQRLTVETDLAEHHRLGRITPAESRSAKQRQHGKKQIGSKTHLALNPETTKWACNSSWVGGLMWELAPSALGLVPSQLDMEWQPTGPFRSADWPAWSPSCGQGTAAPTQSGSTVLSLMDALRAHGRTVLPRVAWSSCATARRLARLWRVGAQPKRHSDVAVDLRRVHARWGGCGTREKGVPVLGVIKWGVTYDIAQWSVHVLVQSTNNVLRDSWATRDAWGQCVKSVTRWLYNCDKHADKLCMWKTCARQVNCLHTRRLPGDYISGKQNKNHSSRTIKEGQMHCSLQDEDFHESQFHIDHKSLLGCHRDDEDEDECVVEEG